jgi:predicted phage tail protein
MGTGIRRRRVAALVAGCDYAMVPRGRGLAAGGDWGLITGGVPLVASWLRLYAACGVPLAGGGLAAGGLRLPWW